MRLWRLASTGLLLAGLSFLPLPVPADEKVALEAVEAIDGQSLRLKDGTILRLAGIIAPDPQNRPEQAQAEAARKALQALAVGKVLQAQMPTDRRDRHDRRLLHIVDGEGRWLQGELLSAGLARVWTQPDASERAAEMLALEAQARSQRRGLWALPYFAILTPETASAALDRFQIVEVAIADVARVRGTVYLNTGTDWRSDFTARLERSALTLFAEAGRDVAALKGKWVHIRGWLRLYNGPFIDVTHPQQIEVIDP